MSKVEAVVKLLSEIEVKNLSLIVEKKKDDFLLSVKHGKDDIYIQMLGIAPFGISNQKNSDKFPTTYDKFSYNFQVSEEFEKWYNEYRNKMIDLLVENSETLFEKKKSRDVIEDNYKSAIKQDKEKKYAKTIQVQVPLYRVTDENLKDAEGKKVVLGNKTPVKFNKVKKAGDNSIELVSEIDVNKHTNKGDESISVDFSWAEKKKLDMINIVRMGLHIVKKKDIYDDFISEMVGVFPYESNRPVVSGFKNQVAPSIQPPAEEEEEVEVGHSEEEEEEEEV